MMVKMSPDAYPNAFKLGILLARLGNIASSLRELGTMFAQVELLGSILGHLIFAAFWLAFGRIIAESQVA